MNIAVGVAELRNQGFGSGRGQASAPSGLGVRHARLTVNAAVTWCELILDTLSDPTAPWRKAKVLIAPSSQIPCRLQNLANLLPQCNSQARRRDALWTGSPLLGESWEMILLLRPTESPPHRPRTTP
ncbi:abortive infection family protein [Streptomyces sp. NPDC089173]|uniref:abortive infection family protein n=1 Tax=Streptomyces sp. NPDC089173 TaxID=3154965 RepID=UPI00344E62DC